MTRNQLTTELVYELVRVLWATPEGVCGCCLHIITEGRSCSPRLPTSNGQRRFGHFVLAAGLGLSLCNPT